MNKDQFLSLSELSRISFDEKDLDSFLSNINHHLDLARSMTKDLEESFVLKPNANINSIQEKSVGKTLEHSHLKDLSPYFLDAYFSLPQILENEK